MGLSVGPTGTPKPADAEPELDQTSAVAGQPVAVKEAGEAASASGAAPARGGSAPIEGLEGNVLQARLLERVGQGQPRARPCPVR